MTVRVIPRLDIKGPNLVKGIHLEGLRVIGKPERFAELYYRQGADELICMDVVASLYGRNSILEVVRRTARDVFIPLTVGGGIRTLDDIREVLRAGADKVAINTAAIRDPDFIRQASSRFGSSTIVVSIEVIAQQGRYEAFTENGRESTGRDAVVWAVAAAELGAGEIMVTSVDREGTGRGFDLELIGEIAERVPVPVIASGGAGSTVDVADLLRLNGVNAVAIASLLHYAAAVAVGGDDEDYAAEGNTEFLRNLRVPSRLQPVSIGDLKRALMKDGVDCRPPLDVAL